MKKRLTLWLVLLGLILSVKLSSCKITAGMSSKSGAQIWGENCIRCHNAASPETFSDSEWDIVAMHMQDKANLTEIEIEKVIHFLKAANSDTTD